MGWVIAVNQTILVIILFRPAWNGCETWTLLVDSNKTKQKRIQAFETKCLRKRLRSSYLEHKTNEWVGAISASLWVHRNPLWQPSRDGTCMIRACHTPRQPVKDHPSGRIGGWATPWSAEEMLAGQRQRVDIPARAKTAHKGPLQKRLEEDLCWIVPHVPPTTQSVMRLNWTDLSYVFL